MTDSTDDNVGGKSIDKNADQNRVYWHSRRGMLEIDLALMPFAKEVYPDLPETEKALYKKLLESEDTELFAWVLQNGRPEDEGLAMIMDKIISYAQTTKS